MSSESPSADTGNPPPPPAAAAAVARDPVDSMAHVHGLALERQDPLQLFEIVETIGGGTFGSVYRARNRETGECVAVKQVPLSDLSEMDAVRREILTLQQCKHPNIVNYRGTYRSNLELWITLEYCAGGSFDNILKVTQTPLSEARAAWVAKEMLQGLAYLHSRHTIHRDIKGGNVLLTEHGEVKLTDFGVSVQMMHTLSKRNSFNGTLHWMAPEAICESDYDQRADIWSLGITVMELVQLVPPHFDMHPARVLFHIPKEPPPKLDNPEQWSPAMHRFLQRCLTKHPDQRPTADELLLDPWILGAPRNCSAEDMKKFLVEYIAKAQAKARAGKDDPRSSGMDMDTETPRKGATGTGTGGAGKRKGGGGGVGGTADDPTFIQLSEAHAAQRGGAEALAQYKLGVASVAGLERNMLVDIPLVSLSDMSYEELTPMGYHSSFGRGKQQQPQLPIRFTLAQRDSTAGTSHSSAAAATKERESRVVLNGVGEQDPVVTLTQRVYPGGVSPQQQQQQQPQRSNTGQGQGAAAAAATDEAGGEGEHQQPPVQLPKHLTYVTQSLLRSFQHYTDGIYTRGVPGETIESGTTRAQKYGSLLKSILQI